jgi:pyruvate/2-oxoglutarate dehydrogenase complex dihydrolipoamide dehydrogenase (E3) component
VGLHMVGQGSDEGIQGFSVAVKMGGASKSRLDLRFMFLPISSYKEEL